MRIADGRKKKSKVAASVAHPRPAAAATRACWCGNSDLVPFGPEYGECRDCGTLVYLQDTPPEQLLVNDDESDYYGKKYWLEHQQDAFGYPDIHNRARKDLSERNLHWLNALIKYRPPPAAVLEVGCAHGSFVALMRQAGYEASGLELSPWVVAFGRQLFGIPVHAGPVESLDIPAGSLDAIVLMDVLEHLPDPTATMRRCLELLKPTGLLLVQTPCFKEGVSHADLVESKDRFLEMLIPVEHIYLFSPRSATEFFRRLGAAHIAFEPAIFDHYDMFFAVSRAPLESHSTEETAAALLATPGGRMALALLDLRESARQQVDSLTGWARDAQAEAAELRDYQANAELQMKTLNGWVEEARAETAQLREQHSSAVQQIKTLTAWVEEARAEALAAKESLASQATSHAAEVATLDSRQKSAAQQIETLTGWVHEAREANRVRQESSLQQIETLTGWVHEAREARAALQEQQHLQVKQIETLTAWVHEAREANATLRKAMDEQAKTHAAQLAEITGLHAGASSQVETLAGLLERARGTNDTLMIERDEQKKAHAEQLAELASLNRSAASQIETLTGWVREAREANAKLQDSMEDLKKAHADQMAQLTSLSVGASRQVETLTSWVHEAREANATLQGAMDEQDRAHAAQLAQAREASAALQKAFEEHKEAHAREVGELRELLARPLLKFALGMSNIGAHPAKSGGERR